MKKLAMLFTLILLGFGLGGCGKSQTNKPQTITTEQNIPAVLNNEIKERLISDYVLNRESYRGGESDEFDLLRLQSTSSQILRLREQRLYGGKNKLPKEAKIEIVAIDLVGETALVWFKVVEPKKKAKTYRISLKYTLEEGGKEAQNPFGFKVWLYEKEEVGRSKQGNKK